MGIRKLPRISSIPAEIRFDGIFLCKSPEYSLPMYDHYFNQLVDLLEARFVNTNVLQAGVKYDRWKEIAA